MVFLPILVTVPWDVLGFEHACFVLFGTGHVQARLPTLGARRRGGTPVPRAGRGGDIEKSGGWGGWILEKCQNCPGFQWVSEVRWHKLPPS